MLKVLTADIETSPQLAHVWGLWNQNIGLSQLLESGEVICLSTKWHHEPETQFFSVHRDGKTGMLEATRDLLDEADALVTWNGDRFDIPHLNREFLEQGMDAPAPYRSIDLIRTVKKQFRFPSNKLDYVASRLGFGHKVSHTGHQLWVDCLKGDEDAWRLMEEYNRQDVVLTEKLYDKLLPWIIGHPVVGLYGSEIHDSCPACGSLDLQKRGFAYTNLTRYQRLWCTECGRWSRGKTSLGSVDVRGVAQ